MITPPRESAARIALRSLELLAAFSLFAPLAAFCGALSVIGALLSLPFLSQAAWSALAQSQRQGARRFEQAIGVLSYSRCDWRRRRELAGAQPPGFFQPKSHRLADRLAGALARGDHRAARAALKNGADPLFDLDGSGYATPLAIACAQCQIHRERHLPIALLLMETRGPGANGLEIAIRAHCLPLIQAALRLGADPNAPALASGNPFIEPAAGPSSLLDRLLEGPPSLSYPVFFDPFGPPELLPLLLACSQPYYYRQQEDSTRWALAEALIEAGADVNQANPAGNTALLICALNARFELAQALLERGADPFARDLAGRDALDIARGHPKMNHCSKDFAMDFERILIAKQERLALIREIGGQEPRARSARSRL